MAAEQIAGAATGAASFNPVGLAISGLIQVASAVGGGIAKNVAGRRNAEAQERVNRAYNEFDQETFDASVRKGKRDLSDAETAFSQQKYRANIVQTRKIQDFESDKMKARNKMANSILMQNRTSPTDRIGRLDRNILKLNMDNADERS